MSELQRDDIEVQPASLQDANERRALLLHLGDVVESIGCVLKCAERHRTIGEAAADEESLASFPILGLVTPQLTPHDFAARAATAFFLWTKELLEPTLNRKLLAYTIQHDLFAGNQSGWESYVALLRAQVPWFGEGLGPVADAEAEFLSTSLWPARESGQRSAELRDASD
ncbi:hypothetical protein AWB76_05257 [Caballeronia temeraria]|uniref:Uncharacterized protein n=2 Tax=Caballeronia TaxID=1827195 RepID=A0A158CX19_9BURK|nr:MULTISPECIES: hypothetical protein [Caballeronia]SAK78814.1 hypothetical protein AWB76_05257 [Caballeronia temeraria]SAK86904.1 hypothetical protein AWB77_04664 [Caballeronia fortuita]